MVKSVKKEPNEVKNVKKAVISINDLNSDIQIIKAQIENLSSKPKKSIKKSTKNSLLESRKHLVTESVKSFINELNRTAGYTDKKRVLNKIDNLLTSYNNTLFSNAYGSLKGQKELGIPDIEGGMYKEGSYIAYIFFFWNIKHMNFRIIGLTEITPLFELRETREMYYLHIPTMSNKGIPIFWLTKGVSLSIELDISNQMDSLITEFKVKGYSPDVIRAMLDSPQFIRIYGKQTISAKFVIMVILLMIIEGFVLYTIFNVIFRGAT